MEPNDAVISEVEPNKHAVAVRSPSNEKWRSVCLQSEMLLQLTLAQNRTSSLKRPSCLLQYFSTAKTLDWEIYRRVGGGRNEYKY